MTARYDLLITSMQEAARTVTILAGLALAIIGARWSIRFAPEWVRPALLTCYDIWLVTVTIVLFIVAP